MNKKMNKVNASSKTQARSNAQSNAQLTNKTNSNGYNSCNASSNYNE